MIEDVSLAKSRGHLIAFEGIDGTGKSTHCRLLADFLESRGFPVLRLREPTQGIWGKKIREIIGQGRKGLAPEDELELFIKDRKEDVELNILPALKEKKLVLIDRYYHSTAAYQGALGLDPERICRENEIFAPVPDRVFIFISPLETCLRRIAASRSSGPDSFETHEYLQKVQRIFDAFSGSRFRRIDSSGEYEAVQARLRNEMEEFLTPR